MSYAAILLTAPAKQAATGNNRLRYGNRWVKAQFCLLDLIG
jgi:hypothetical protein